MSLVQERRSIGAARDWDETMDGDERDLIARLRAGDEGAYGELIRTLGARMLAVTRRFLRDEQDQADALQEAFISVFRSIRNFEGESRLATWLQRIVINACLMKLRSKARRSVASLEDLPVEVADTGRAATGAGYWSGANNSEWDRTVDHACRTELCAKVRECIDRLPERHRSVLMLRDIEELGTDETARRLGTTPGAVKVRLHRARHALRDLLAPVVA